MRYIYFQKFIYPENYILCLCIFSLFNDTDSNSYYVMLNDWLVVNNDLKRMQM
jgi:hypothetical protein